MWGWGDTTRSVTLAAEMRRDSGAGRVGAHFTCLPQKSNLVPKALSNSHVLQKVWWENRRGSYKHSTQQMSPSFLFTSQLLFECISHRSYWFSLRATRLQQNKASLKPEEASPSGSICMPDSEQAFHLDYVFLQTHDNLRGGFNCLHTCFTGKKAKAQRGAGTLAKVPRGPGEGPGLRTQGLV